MDTDKPNSSEPDAVQVEPPKYNIAIIEDNLATREALSDHFANSSRITCVLAVDTVDKFLKFYREFLELHLILVDLRLYDKSGIDGIPMIRAREPEAEIVVFTSSDDYDSVFTAICSGATGYLLKDLNPQELEDKIIDTLENGGALLSPSVAKRIIQYFGTRKASIKQKEEALNQQESLVVTLLRDALKYEDIAQHMGITINGVRYHVKNIYRKLQVKSRAELMRKNK